MFPEGTTINLRSINQSQEYAKKQLRPVLENVLLPRTVGLTACLKALSTVDYENTIIIDLTMIYDSFRGIYPVWGYVSDDEPNVPSIGRLLRGMNTRVHYIIHSIPLKKFNINKSDEEFSDSIQKWIDLEWELKDKELKYFIEHDKVENEEKNHIEIPIKYDLRLNDIIYITVPSLLFYAILYILPKSITMIMISIIVIYAVIIPFRANKQ